MYYLSNLIARGWGLSPLGHADLLVVAPKVTQALFASLGDFYTWKLADYVFGADSVEAWATVCGLHSTRPTNVDDFADSVRCLPALTVDADCGQSLAIFLLNSNTIQLS